MGPDRKNKLEESIHIVFYNLKIKSMCLIKWLYIFAFIYSVRFDLITNLQVLYPFKILTLILFSLVYFLSSGYLYECDILYFIYLQMAFLYRLGKFFLYDVKKDEYFSQQQKIFLVFFFLLPRFIGRNFITIIFFFFIFLAAEMSRNAQF